MFRVYDGTKQTLLHIPTGGIYSSSSVEYREWRKQGNIPEAQPNDYAEQRKAAYAPIAEQLDMMYHGTWATHIASVKGQIPKGNVPLPLPDWATADVTDTPPPKMPGEL